MDDEKILALYWGRSERAIKETEDKYGRLCKLLVNNILQNEEEELECLNDAYYSIWNAIVDMKPTYFSVFICKITRTLALMKYDYTVAQKRKSNVVSSLGELGDLADSKSMVEREYEAVQLGKLISMFLRTIPVDSCNLFLRRYWFYDSIKELSSQFQMSQGKVKYTLLRTRKKLKLYLEREGVPL